MKVNVGAGIEVADDWIHVDGSIHALMAGAPRALLSFLYRHTQTVSRLLTEDEYINCLKDHTFVFHNLEHGLPFDSNTVDFIFCSHVLEHFHRHDGERLVREIVRVLKPGGRARVCVPDLAIAIRLYEQGKKHDALQYFYRDSRAESYDQHCYMYDYELLETMLLAQGFSSVRECAYREGEVPDLATLDNRPGETLYIEATKSSDRENAVRP